MENFKFPGNIPYFSRLGYFSLFTVFYHFLVAPSHTFPVDIQARAKNKLLCANGKQGPCICGKDGNLVNIQSKKALDCGTGSFKYTNPKDDKDGSVEYVRGLDLNEFRRSQPL